MLQLSGGHLRMFHHLLVEHLKCRWRDANLSSERIVHCPYQEDHEAKQSSQQQSHG